MCAQEEEGGGEEEREGERMPYRQGGCFAPGVLGSCVPAPPAMH
jgi:hypothetical protein